MPRRQPRQIPDTVLIPRTFSEALAALTHPDSDMPGELRELHSDLWLVHYDPASYTAPAGLPSYHYIQLVWRGIPLITYISTDWIYLNTSGKTGIKAIFDIYTRLFANTFFTLTASDADWPEFYGGSWTIAVSDPTLGVSDSARFSDGFALHPPTGSINPTPHEPQD